MKFFSNAYERYVLAIMGGNKMKFLTINQCKLHPQKPSEALHAQKRIKTNAATNIQAIVRGNLARNSITVKAAAATKIQAIVRGKTEFCAITFIRLNKRAMLKTRCGHFFHKESLIQWLNTKQNTCPCCRRKEPLKETRHENLVQPTTQTNTRARLYSQSPFSYNASMLLRVSLLLF